MEKQSHWWQTGVIYEIYPRSFNDSNNDGVGDIKGIIEKLDYLVWLGVDAIWICPFYPSPMVDLGYDISDYQGVHEIFGTMKDVEDLLQESHKRGLKVIIDLVPNHTSNKHPWFLESRSSKENAKRDWYIWHDADLDGNPPNNWLGVFGGSAWEWCEERKQFYYHAFLAEQPDLNLRNPEVQEAIFEVMRYWLEKCVDGFRVDVMWHLYKDPLFRDNPANPNYKQGQPEYDKLLPYYTTDYADVIDIVTKLRNVVDEYDARVLIGEMYLSINQTVSYYGPNNTGAHLPGNFTLLLIEWNANKVRSAIDECESALPPGAWPNWVLGNHDRPRLSTRVGSDQLRVAAMLLLTLRGTPTIYYGEEIGMRNIEIPKEETQDPQGKKMGVNRDGYRAPMPWGPGPNGGFSSAEKLWLRMDNNTDNCNVERHQQDAGSLLNLYKELLQLRKQEKALQSGNYIPIPQEKQLLVYLRVLEKRRIMIALNLGKDSGHVNTTKFDIKGRILIHTSLERKGEIIEGTFSLGGGEGIVIALD